MKRVDRSLSITVALILAIAGSASADWSTSQGDLRRSGFLDDIDGPRKPEVLWVLPERSSFAAAPALTKKMLFVPSLGGLGAPECAALALDPKAKERMKWSLTSPVFELPTAAAPVVRDSVLYVGEGMHTNRAGALTAIDAERGLPLWRHVVAGYLCHVEGAATVDAAGRIYFGSGSGGVICLDGSKIRSGGVEYSLADYRKRVHAEWGRLQAAYEKVKEEQGFASRVDEVSILENLAPTVSEVWTAGREKLHVDAPVTLVEFAPKEGPKQRRLLIGSAFLDVEKRGYRGIVCLNAEDGSEIWRHDVRWNPWGAPSVARVEIDGETQQIAIVTCSSIRFDPRTIRGARGAVVAIDIASGDTIWSHYLRGGVLGSAAIDPSRRRAVVGASDGTVLCLDVASGAVVWQKRARKAVFSGVAVDRNTAYSVDLDAEVRAWSLGRGELRWKKDLARDPRIGLPSRVFGSVTAAGGRLFIATHNLEGRNTGAPAYVVCLGDRDVGRSRSEGVVVDREKGRVIIDVEIAPRKLLHLDEIYPIEVMATSPQGKKAHETVFVTDVRPSDVHRALETLGLRSGKPTVGRKTKPTGPEVSLWVEYSGIQGLKKRIDLSRTVIDRRTGLPIESGVGPRTDRVRWLFTGSTKVESESADGTELLYGADLSGTLATLYSVTAETVFQSNLTMNAETFLSLDVAKFLPAVGTKAKLVVEPVRKEGGAK